MITGLLFAPICGLSVFGTDCYPVMRDSIEHPALMAPAMVSELSPVATETGLMAPPAGDTAHTNIVTVAVSTSASEGDRDGVGDGRCQVFWGGEPITSRQLLVRGQRHLRDLLVTARQDEDARLIDIIEVQISGDANLPYRCIGGVIYTLEYAGFQRIVLNSQPDSGRAVVSNLPVQPFTEGLTSIRISIDASGNISGNDTLIPETGLPEYLTLANANGRTSELLVEPNANARFGSVISLLATIQRSGVVNPSLIGNYVYAYAF